MTTVEPIRNLTEIRKFENYFSKNSERDLVWFTLGTNCGLRISDICLLNIGDVRDKNFIYLKEQKTGKFKKFPMNTKVKGLINNFVKGKRSDEPLFKTIFGNRLDRFGAYYILKTAAEEIGWQGHIGTHTLRKTFGYHHYKKFKDVAMLQKIFNHSSPVITLRYIGIEQDEIDESYANFIL